MYLSQSVNLIKCHFHAMGPLNRINPLGPNPLISQVYLWVEAGSAAAPQPAGSPLSGHGSPCPRLQQQLPPQPPPWWPGPSAWKPPRPRGAGSPSSSPRPPTSASPCHPRGSRGQRTGGTHWAIVGEAICILGHVISTATTVRLRQWHLWLLAIVGG